MTLPYLAVACLSGIYAQWVLAGLDQTRTGHSADGPQD